MKPTTDSLFDLSPIRLLDEGGRNGFKLGACSAVAVGRPTIVQAQEALKFAGASHVSSPYWIGDILRYVESRTDWQEKVFQILDVTGLSLQRIQNITSVCNRVEEDERAVAPSLAHAEVVAPLSKTEQRRWLEKARTEKWTERELRLEVRTASRARIIEGQAKLEGRYRVVYADPPWAYRGGAPHDPKSKVSTIHHYSVLTIQQLCDLPVVAHALPNSVLFLWVPAPLLFEMPGPREVVTAWGFEPKAGFVWDKVLGNPGAYNHVTHEHLIVATRGIGTPDRPTPQPKSVFTERRADEHSAKPDSVRTMIEKLYDGPYLELFGRKRVENWTVFGNDARLWQAGPAKERTA